MKGILTNKRLALFWIILWVFSIGSAYAYTPTMVLGLVVEELIFPGNSTTDYLTNIQLNGLFGWSTKLESGGYFALNSSAELNSYLYSPAEFSDTENLELEATFPLGPNRLDMKAGLGASLLGTSAYARPDWQLKYSLERGRRKLRPYVAYEGYYLYQYAGSEDALYQGAEAGFAYRPSIRLGYQASLEGGWESWLEYPLYNSTGSLTQEKRGDLLVMAKGQLDGLIGYFLSWQLDSNAGLRWSNVNRYLENLSYLEVNSASNWFIYGGGSLKWSPNRKVDLQVGTFVRPEFYLEREALTEGGALSGEVLRVISTGLNARIDWTLNDRMYLVGTGSSSWLLSNDPNEERWNVTVGLGIEHSF